MIPEKTLASLADVQTGYPFRGKIDSDPNGTCYVIHSRDINADLSLKVDDLTKFKMPAGTRSESKQLKPDDILVMSRTDRPYAIQLPANLPKSVAHTSFFAIRISKPNLISADFLHLLLNSNLLQNRLQSLIKGTSIPYIRIDDLRSLSIPLPPLEKQNQITRLHDAFRREAQLHRQLEATRQELIDDLILSA